MSECKASSGIEIPLCFLFHCPFQSRTENTVQRLLPVVTRLNNRKLGEDPWSEICRSVGRVSVEILAAPDGRTDDTVGGAAQS